MKLFRYLNIPEKDYYKAAIIGLAIFISFFVFSFRFVSEQRNMKVEMVYDYEDVLLLQAYSGQPQEQIFRMLQKAGVTSICLPEDTLIGLAKQGKATWISGEDLLNMSRLGQIQSYILTNLIRSADIVPENFYVMVDMSSAFERVKNSLINELGPERARVVGPNIIEVKGQVDNLGQIGLGLDTVLAGNLAWYKFQIIPKLVNSKRMDDVSMGLKIDRIRELGSVYTVIFSGTEALGYGNNMRLVADKMKANTLNYGVIEFANQKGAKDLAALLPGHTIGVHSIDIKPLQEMSQAKAIDRYLLAAVDRGMRILYVHPFYSDKIKGDLLAYNEEYITALKNKLERRGFQIVPIQEINMGFGNIISTIFGFLISFGVAVAFFYFLKLFIPDVPELVLHYLLGLFFIVNIVFLKFDYFNQWRSILALIVSVIFPVYAMITQLPKDNNWHEKVKSMEPRDFIKIILRIVGITLIGALLIIGLLSDVYHMLKIYQFRGVKIAFGLPILLVAFYYFLYPYRIKSIRFLIRRFLQSQVTIGYVVAFMGVAMFFALYLLRSGNYQLPITGMESDLRKFLGFIMVVRPRTKEFLIGWPLMVFMLYNLGSVINYKNKWMFYTVATVAPISLLNTFCHLHAPLWLSVLRSFNGLVLGLIIGFVSLSVYKFLSRFWKFVL